MRYQSLHQGLTGGKTILQILLRAALWMVAFNILYLVVNPFQNGGLPTVYNSVIPGRLRVAWTNTDSAYVVNELKISRLLADLTVARPKAADEFRVIVLGSSETWGYFNRAQDTWPVVLDNMHIATPEGKSVRVYNLAFPLPDSLKDIMLIQYAIDHNFQPDLIIWAVNALTFNPLARFHDLALANPDLALAVADRYGLDNLPLEDIREAAASPVWQRQNFFAERDNVAYWLMNQMFGFVWATTQVDYPFPDPIPHRTEFGGTLEWENKRPDTIEALAQLAHSYDIPLLVLSTPVNYSAENFKTWLASEATALRIPLLNCEKLLPIKDFTNTNLHMTAQGHVRLAEQVLRWLRVQLGEASVVPASPAGCISSPS
jgi:hypothetical protein